MVDSIMAYVHTVWYGDDLDSFANQNKNMKNLIHIEIDGMNECRKEMCCNTYFKRKEHLQVYNYHVWFSLLMLVLLGMMVTFCGVSGKRKGQSHYKNSYKFLWASRNQLNILVGYNPKRLDWFNSQICFIHFGMDSWIFSSVFFRQSLLVF